MTTQMDGFYMQDLAWNEAEKLQSQGFITRVFWNIAKGSWSVVSMTLEEWKNLQEE